LRTLDSNRVVIHQFKASLDHSDPDILAHAQLIGWETENPTLCEWLELYAIQQTIETWIDHDQNAYVTRIVAELQQEDFLLYKLKWG